MPTLPLVRQCCGCLSLEIGVYSLCLLSTLACLANITAGAWGLANHTEREPEDNFLSMSTVMFSSLSTISNMVAAAGAYLRRPSYIQLSLLFNMIFLACNFLIAVVTCIFSPELKRTHFLDSPENITLVIILMCVDIAYTIYYLSVINSFYRSIKDDYESAIPI